MDEIKEDREGFLNGFLRGYEISEELEGNTDPQGRRSYGLKMTLGGQDVDQKPAPYLPEQDIELLYPRPRLGWGTDTARQEELVQSKLPKIKDVRLIARSDWAAYPPDYSGLKGQSRPYTGIVLHHTGNTDTPKEVEELQRNRQPPFKSAIRSIGSTLGLAQKYRMDDVGYNFLVAKDGTIYKGRSLSLEGAHVYGKNAGNIGIAFLGNYSDAPLSPAAVESAFALMEGLKERYGLGENGKSFIRVHGSYDESKRDELHGARDQIWRIESRLLKKERSENR